MKISNQNSFQSICGEILFNIMNFEDEFGKQTVIFLSGISILQTII